MRKREGKTHLVTVAKREVLDADVLVGVLGALLKRGHVIPVLPVLIPEVVSVDATANQAGDNSTVGPISSNSGSSPRSVQGQRGREIDAQDGELKPQACIVNSSVNPDPTNAIIS